MSGAVTARAAALALAALPAFAAPASADKHPGKPLLDPGKQSIGALEATVLLATDKDPAVAGKSAAPVAAATAKRLRSEKRLSFAHYRLLGKTSAPIYRSYENWAEPLKPSDEVLVRFEAQGRASAEAVRLDIELWLSRKKILKTDAVLAAGRPIYILGPEWRGGRIIVAIALAQPPTPAP
jgi:hypothetical protein